MLFLLLGGGILYFLLGDRSEGLILLSFVFVVLAMTYFQKRKTEQALTALAEVAAPRTTVIRGSVRMVIPVRQVVRGDLLVLSEGDRIPADLRLLDGRLLVDESILTGESLPVLKLPGSEDLGFGRPGESASPFVFAGTMVTNGSGIARVHATGEHSAIGGIGVAPSGNMGDNYAVFEAVHGSAPKYANLDVADPSSLLLSAVMLLRYIKWNEPADLIEKAFVNTLRDKQVPQDLARHLGVKSLKTSEFAESIVQHMVQK